MLVINGSLEKISNRREDLVAILREHSSKKLKFLLILFVMSVFRNEIIEMTVVKCLISYYIGQN